MSKHISKIDYIESKVVPFKENVCKFSADYNAFGKRKVLNSHKYLMVKNNIENVWIYKANLYCFIKFQWIKKCISLRKACIDLLLLNKIQMSFIITYLWLV